MLSLVLVFCSFLYSVQSTYYQFNVNHNQRHSLDNIRTTTPLQYFEFYETPKLKRSDHDFANRESTVSVTSSASDDKDRNLALNELINKIKNRLNHDRGGNRKYNYNSESSKSDQITSSSNSNKWVSLEAVPWSVGTVSKWSNKNQYQNNYDSPPTQASVQSSDFYSQQSNKNQPTIVYDCNNHKKQNYRPYFSGTNSNYNSNSNYHPDSNLIITDNRPGAEFPSDNGHSDNNRRHEFYHYSDHKYKPDSNEGQWILLSTNKGYQYPRPKSSPYEATFLSNFKKNSNNNENESTISSKRTVKMLVLPSENEKDQILSHNGLIEVARNKRTVDEDKLFLEKKNFQLKNDVMKSDLKILKAYQAGLIPASLRFI